MQGTQKLDHMVRLMIFPEYMDIEQMVSEQLSLH